MEKSRKFSISINFYDVKDEKVIMKGTIFVDNENNSFDYLKSQAKKYYEIESDAMKGFYAPQTESQNKSLIRESEVWVNWVRKLVANETESCDLYCVRNEESIEYEDTLDAKFNQTKKGNKRKIRTNKKSNNKLEGEIDKEKKPAKKLKPSEEDSISLSDHDNDEKSNYFIEFSRGENDQSIKYKLDKLLGNDAFSSAYSLVSCVEKKETSNDLVAKVFINKERFENEQKTMEKIAKGGEVGKVREESDGTIIYKLDNLSDKFIKPVAANANKKTIIYTPRGEKLHRPISRKHFNQMLDCLRELQKSDIIHRNITPDHFLSTKVSSKDECEKIFLIGFSSAVFIQNKSKSESSDADNQVNYEGSIPFAATKILDCLVNKENYTPHQSHDLESFVKTFYLFNMPEDNELFRNDADFDTRVKCAHEYWHKFENKAPMFWKKALEIVRETSKDIVEKLYKHFDNFHSFKIDYISSFIEPKKEKMIDNDKDEDKSDDNDEEKDSSDSDDDDENDNDDSDSDDDDDSD